MKNKVNLMEVMMECNPEELYNFLDDDQPTFEEYKIETEYFFNNLELIDIEE